MDVLTASQILRRVSPKFPIEFSGLFGSVARGESDQGSDVDVFAVFEDGHRLSDEVEFRCELEDAFERPVDLVTTLDGASAMFRRELEQDMVISYAR